jgi:hypothetical protein
VAGQLQDGRTVALCDKANSSVELPYLDVPLVDGIGGSYFSDYSRFLYLVHDAPIPSPLQGYIGLAGYTRVIPPRADLLSLMNVTHALLCDPTADPHFQFVQMVGQQYLYRNVQPLPRAFFVCDVEVVSTRDAVIERLRSLDVDVGRSALVLASESQPPPVLHDATCPQTASVQGTSKDNADGSFTADVLAPNDGFVVLSEVYFPERRAWIDGSEVPVQRTDLAFAGVYVPAGAHRIELRYVPTRFYQGTAVTIVTILAWFGTWIWSRRRVRGKTTRTKPVSV